MDLTEKLVETWKDPFMRGYILGLALGGTAIYLVARKARPKAVPCVGCRDAERARTMERLNAEYRVARAAEEARVKSEESGLYGDIHRGVDAFIARPPKPTESNGSGLTPPGVDNPVTVVTDGP